MPNHEILYWGEFNGFEGGIERYAWKTAAALRECGFHVRYAGNTPGRNPELFRSGFDQVLSPEAVFRSGIPFDLVMLHKIPRLEILDELTVRFGKRLVFCVHDHDLYCPRHHAYTPFGRVNCRRAYAPMRCRLCAALSAPRNWRKMIPGHAEILRKLRARHLVVLSEFMQDNLLRNGFSSSRIHVIRPFLECGEKRDGFLPDGILRLLFLGQLIRGKGADLLLEVLSRLRIPWRAVFAGDGNDRSRLEKRAVRIGLSGQIEFSGWTDAPEVYFRQADVTVLPFRWQEPFGLSGLESAAAGVPVVAFDVGGVREWLVNGKNGFAVPERDCAAMAEKIELLFHRRELLSQMSSAGQSLVREKFTPTAFILALFTLMESLK